MTQIGAPDFLADQQWSDETTLFNASVNTSIAGTTIGPFPVSQWLGVALSIQVNFADVQMTVTYFADAANTIQTAQRQILLPFFVAPAQMTLPNLGPYVTIQFTTLGVQTPGVNVVAAGTNRIGPTFPSNLMSPLIELTNQSIPATTTSSFDFAFFFSGPSHFACTAAAGTGQMRLEYLDVGGGTHRFMIKSIPFSPADQFFAPVYIPPAHCRLTVQNTSAAPIAINAYVMPDAWRNES